MKDTVVAVVKKVSEHKLLYVFLLFLTSVAISLVTFHGAEAVVILVVLGTLNLKYRKWELLFVTIFTLVLWCRVLLHGIVMFFYINPALIEGIVLATILSLVVARWQWKDDTSDDKLIKGAGLYLVLLLVFCPIFYVIGDSYAKEHIANELSVQELNYLPALDLSQTRILPKIVANKYIKDSAQYARFTPSDPHIIVVDNQPRWVSILSPEGLVNSIILNAKGIAGVNATIIEKSSFVVEQDLAVAPGRFITSEVWYKLVEMDYFANYEYSYPVIYDNKLYLIVPKVTYSYEFRFPAFYTVPRWAGLAIIDGAGHIDILSPDEARQNPILYGQRLFPEELARLYVDAINYKLGIGNIWLTHEEQFNIVDIDIEEQGNKQPFLVKTENELEWLFAVKPYGAVTQGVFKVFLLNARTGDVQSYRLSETEPLLGPVVATDYVKKAAPLVDWSTMIAVEPIPVITENKFYWLIRIVPESGAGISYLAVVNAKDGATNLFTSVPDLFNFLTTPELPEAPSPPLENISFLQQIIVDLRQQLQQALERLQELENMISGLQ